MSGVAYILTSLINEHFDVAKQTKATGDSSQNFELKKRMYSRMYKKDSIDASQSIVDDKSDTLSLLRTYNNEDDFGA